MSEIGKIIIAIGLFLVIAGVVIMLVGKIPGAGKLPGDIIVKKENFTFYFPIVTCLILSLLLTLIFSMFKG